MLCEKLCSKCHVTVQVQITHTTTPTSYNLWKLLLTPVEHALKIKVSTLGQYKSLEKGKGKPKHKLQKTIQQRKPKNRKKQEKLMNRSRRLQVLKVRWLTKMLVLIAPTPGAKMVRFIFSLPVQMSQLTIGTDTHMEKSDDNNMYFQLKPKPKEGP